MLSSKSKLTKCKSVEKCHASCFNNSAHERIFKIERMKKSRSTLQKGCDFFCLRFLFLHDPVLDHERLSVAGGGARDLERLVQRLDELYERGEAVVPGVEA